MGFVGPERGSWLERLGIELDERGNVRRDDDFMTNVPGVFVAGDMGRGQSLIVWAIAEGRACAAGVDRYLVGETSAAVADPAVDATAHLTSIRPPMERPGALASAARARNLTRHVLVRDSTDRRGRARPRAARPGGLW